MPAVAQGELVGRDEHARALLLSGDGRLVFATNVYSSAAGKTRVWDVIQQQEIAALPAEAGTAVAVSRDGMRVLCRRKFNEVESSYQLWWRPNGKWQEGTLVKSRTKETLLDAQFVAGNVVILWRSGVERRDAAGRWRRTTKWRSKPNYFKESKVEDGALSRSGTRAVLFVTDGYQEFRAPIFDAQSGRPLKPLTLNKSPIDFDWNVDWKFSPDGSIVGWTFGAVPDNISAPAGATNHTQTLWDASTGQKLGESSNPIIAFWPASPSSLLSQTFDSASSPKEWDENSREIRWKIQRLDARTQKPLSFGISRIGDGFWLNDIQISDDGKTLVALDIKGGIWQEKI